MTVCGRIYILRDDLATFDKMNYCTYLSLNTELVRQGIK
jgi:hypothetical protein